MSGARARSRGGARAPRVRRALVAVLLLPACLAAQRLPFNLYDAEDGLTGTQIWDLHQDRRGLLWVAGTWGFSSFDGARFTSLSTREGLPSPNARVVIEDGVGHLWLGTNDGVARFDGRTITTFAHGAAPRQTVWDAAIDSAGRLWFATQSGLYRFARGEFRRFGHADGLASDYVYSLLVAADGALWAGSRGAGLARCGLDAAGDLVDCRVLGTRDGLASEVVRALVEAPDGRILAGTRGGGLAIVSADRITTLRAGDGLPDDDIYTLLVRRDGRIVIGGTDGGLAICLGLEPLRCRIIREENGLPDNAVRSLLEDVEGSLWVGTEGGLAQLVREDLWSYGEAEGLVDGNVYALASDGGSGLWIGTTAGLAHLAIGAHGEPRMRRYDRSHGLPTAGIWALHTDRRRDVWVGTEAGLCRMRSADADRCEQPAGLGGLAAAYVLCLDEDADGALWAGTTAGVFRLLVDETGAPRGVERFTQADGMANDRVYTVTSDANGDVWFAHGEALSRYSSGKFEVASRTQGLDWRSVRGLGTDAAGRLLVGGHGRIARVESAAGEPLRLRKWERGAGLAGHMVLTLGEAADGRLLLGTNHGVLLFDSEARGGEGVVVSHLDSRGGAIATEVSHSEAFARDAGGRLWFGFKGGLTGVLGELAMALPAPRVMVSRLESRGGRVFAAAFTEVGPVPVGWLEGSRPLLPHDDRSLRVWVRAPTYVRRGDLRFQFRLLDVEEEWSEERQEPFRDLMNLAPGRHRLQARAAYTDGDWGEPATLEFRIEPAWWQRSLFPVLTLSAVVGLVVALTGWRVRRIRRLEDELERRIGERTEDLERYATALSEHLQTVDRASDRARRTERLRRDLFARASHELRTPLTAVLGFSELLERSLSERIDDKERRYLAHVRESGELLLKQVNEVLEHFRLESGRVEVHLEECALGDIVESVASLMEGFALHRGVHLAVVASEAPARVRIDVAKLRQALMNLISNAIKFSPAGETVEIEARELEASASPWRRAAYEIVVRDHGAGIPAEELETIFEPYRRLAQADGAPGTGLGLPIARQLVELLGGTLGAEPAAGGGARFVVRLPTDPDPVTPLAEGADSGGFAAERAQVVVLEPDWERFTETTRRLAEDVLAVRVESLDALGSSLAALRPYAVVLPFDPRREDDRSLVAATVELACRRSVSLLLLPTVDSRALALAFARVVRSDASENEMRLALRAAGAAPRRFGRRPLVLVAAPREVGVAAGATLAAAGCDHFRVEGAQEARAALAETVPDAGLLDLAHAFGLAGAPRPGKGHERVVGWLLLAVGRPADDAFTALESAVAAAGEPPAELLRATIAPLLAERGDKGAAQSGRAAGASPAG
jgi:signal transduction histidine kinase/ligand-binding sensor domain-containing protein